MSGPEIRERTTAEEEFDPWTSYIVSQAAHISCKKDLHKILSATVSEGFSEGYEKLQKFYSRFHSET